MVVVKSFSLKLLFASNLLALSHLSRAVFMPKAASQELDCLFMNDCHPNYTGIDAGL